METFSNKLCDFMLSSTSFFFLPVKSSQKLHWRIPKYVPASLSLCLEWVIQCVFTLVSDRPIRQERLRLHIKLHQLSLRYHFIELGGLKWLQRKTQKMALYQAPCPAFRVPIFTTLCWIAMTMMLRKWSDSCALIIPASQQQLQPPHWIFSKWWAQISSELSLTSGAQSHCCSKMRHLEMIVTSEIDAGT